jgi:hypothetical protein
MLATNVNSGHIYQWLKNVAPTGTVVKNPNATLEVGVSGVPSGWTVEDEVE